MRIVFAGTPEFAAGPLQALIDAGHNVVGVLSQPDRPAGRGRKLTASPVSAVALEAGLPLERPQSLRTPQAESMLRAWKPDLMVVIAYGLILPRNILDVPIMGCVNVHASLLPRWRGAAPIQRAIEAGDTQSGLCLMQMDEGLDTGPVLACAALPITPEMTGGALHDALLALSCQNLPGWLRELEEGDLKPAQQPYEGVTYAQKLNKSEARLNLAQPAARLAAQVRAFDPWPVAHVAHAGEMVRLMGAARVIEKTSAEPIGTVVDLSAEGLFVVTGDGLLCVPEMQWPGRKRLPAQQAVQGRGLAIGDVFGGRVND